MGARTYGGARMGLGLTTLAGFDALFLARLRARFFEKVSPEPNTGCWAWTGAVNSRGYGSVGMGCRGHGRAIVRAAHRVSWLLERGELPEGLVLDHLCRNPWCVNPAHLEPVTHAINVQRGAQARGGAR